MLHQVYRGLAVTDKTECAGSFTSFWFTGLGPPYTQATANTRMMGAMAAHFLLFLQSQTGLNLYRVHIIGHSLGAHLCG